MKLGNFFMFGFEGHTPTGWITQMLKREALAGVILFSRNIVSAGQLKELTGALKDAAGREVLIGIDQEGGRVARLPKTILDIEPMAEFGKRYKKSGSLDEIYQLGLQMGEKLLSLGINLDFAPVLDVDTNSKNPVIGDRAFGSDPNAVALMGCELSRGLADAGVIACGKHFPGHGDTSEDSHKILPKLDHDIQRLRKVELIPFRRAAEQRVPSMMTAHVVYEGVDADVPATLSKKIITGILREELGYNGVVFSDDLEMDAIAENYGIGEAGVLAFKAGVDIILVCRHEEHQKEAFDSFKEAIEKGRISEKRLALSAGRIEKMGASLRAIK